jgi:hypothetical protein
MADSDSQPLDPDIAPEIELGEVSEAIKSCVECVDELQKWGRSESGIDPVLETLDFLERFARAARGWGLVKDRFTGASKRIKSLGDIVGASYHECCYRLAERTLNKVAESIDSLLFGPAPVRFEEPAGRWKATIRGIYLVPRKDYPLLQKALAELPVFDAQRLTACLDKERVFAERQEPLKASPAGNTGHGVGPGKEEVSVRLEPADQKAYYSYGHAESKLGRTTDRQAYDYLRDNGLPDERESPELASALAGYKLPTFATWSKQVRNARKRLGEQKHTRRAGRPRGRSTVRGREIERQHGDDE